MIPLANPYAQYYSRKAEIDRAIHRVMDSGLYILGDEVAAFEAEFAAYIGVKFAIGVGSGTEALHLALKACGIRSGDEVVTVSHTAVATVAAIELAGAKPVFADIDPIKYTMEPESLRSAIGPCTKAVIPVHIYGQPAAMDEISGIVREQGLRLIEDCAQAHGAIYKNRRIGSFGDLACFSFYPTKNLGALGDAGAVVTNDQKLAERVRLLREYGWAERFVSQVPGWNTRLDEVQAAVLRVKLKYLDEDNLARVRLAELYRNYLADLPIKFPEDRKDAVHVYHLFVISVTFRDELLSFLRGKGIGAAIHYPVPIHRQPAYIRLGGRLPQTERAVKEILSLPMYPELTSEEAYAVIDAIKEFVKLKTIPIDTEPSNLSVLSERDKAA